MSLVGFYIVQQELADEAVQRVRLERQIREIKRLTAIKRAQLAGGRLVETRPRGGGFHRIISFEEAMQRVEKTHPLTAARLRAARKGN